MLYDLFCRCSVNIPATFIFRSGLPFKGICSDELTGSVKRINIDHIVNLTDSSEMSFISNDERKLNDVRKILIEYSKKYAHFIQNNRTNEPFICTVSIVIETTIKYIIYYPNNRFGILTENVKI